MSETPLVYDDTYIRRILEQVKRIAMVGASANDMRPSYFAMLYLQNKGYVIDPVTPRNAGETILGRTGYAVDSRHVAIVNVDLTIIEQRDLEVVGAATAELRHVDELDREFGGEVRVSQHKTSVVG